MGELHHGLAGIFVEHDRPQLPTGTVRIGRILEGEHQPLWFRELEVLATERDLRASPTTMMTFQVPPTRTSIVAVSSGMWDSRSPNHCANWAGSVHALHTSCRGASKIRVISIPAALCSAFVTASVIIVAFLDFS